MIMATFFNQSYADGEFSASRHGAVLAPGNGDDIARLTLDSRGSISDCNRVGEALFNVHRGKLIGRHVSALLPYLAQFELVQNGQINPHLRFLSHIGCQFETVNQNGERFASEIFLSSPGDTESGQLSLIVRPIVVSSEAGRQAGKPELRFD
jgi:PAS domain-containing protein